MLIVYLYLIPFLHILSDFVHFYLYFLKYHYIYNFFVYCIEYF